MSRFGKFAVVVSVLWFITFTVYASHRTTNLQLLSIPVALLFLVAIVAAIISIFIEWQQRRWRSLLPIAACVVSIVLSSALVRTIRQVIFDRSLPKYEAIVEKMESGSIPVSTNWESFPQAVPLSPLTWGVFGRRDTNGTLAVAFLTESGFPVKHSGYLYISSGVIEPGSMEDSKWPIRKEERPRWFFISD